MGKKLIRHPGLATALRFTSEDAFICTFLVEDDCSGSQCRQADLSDDLIPVWEVLISPFPSFLLFLVSPVLLHASL